MISIVIPAREEEKYIGNTLKRIRDVLKLPHEIIVSDDGSTDKTVEIAKTLADKVVTYKEGTHSPARTRNAGARVAQGDYLLFLDGDSRLPNIQQALTHALKRFEQEPHLVALAGAQWVYPERTIWKDKLVFGIDCVQNWFINNVLHTGWACGKFMCIRRSAFEQVGGFNEGIIFGEDWELYQRLAKIGLTRLDRALDVYHSGRRLHQRGIIRFWGAWIVNGLSVMLSKRARVAEWKPVR